MTPAGTYEAKFYGLGSDGTVGANKVIRSKLSVELPINIVRLILLTIQRNQAVLRLLTCVSVIVQTISPRSTYLITTPDFVACHVPAYIHMYDVLKGLQKGGSFLLNSIWDEEETKKHLPNHMKRYLAENEINFYYQRNEDRPGIRVGQPYEYHHAECILQNYQCYSL